MPFKFQLVIILSTHYRTHCNSTKLSESLPGTLISALLIASEKKLSILVITLLLGINFSLPPVPPICFKFLGWWNQNLTSGVLLLLILLHQEPLMATDISLGALKQNKVLLVQWHLFRKCNVPAKCGLHSFSCLDSSNSVLASISFHVPILLLI